MSNLIDYDIVKTSITTWKDQTGLKDIENPGMNLPYVVGEFDKFIKEMSIEDFELFLTRLASYIIFLKSEKSKIASRISLLKEQYRRVLYQEIARLEQEDSGFKFKKIEEKETMVILGNELTRKMRNEILDNEIKFEQIRDLPTSLDIKIRTLEFIYKQKQRESYGKN